MVRMYASSGADVKVTQRISTSGHRDVDSTLSGVELIHREIIAPGNSARSTSCTGHIRDALTFPPGDTGMRLA
ncbi:MAG TPA: hypothetical protein VN961_23660 [Streptosporangiaceae bacterium]|nr:hypothetical protein [Streptosporangiaceae bacterium]